MVEEQLWIDQCNREQWKSSSSTSGARLGGMGLGGLHISRTDRNQGRSYTKSQVTTNLCDKWGLVAHLITNADYLFLAAVATGGVLFTAVMFDDKDLRVRDLDEVVRMLLGCDSSIQVSIVDRTKITATYAKHALHVS